MAALGLHAQPLQRAPEPEYGTLWDIYLAEGGGSPAPLARAMLSDANVGLLTRAVQAKAVTVLGALSPDPEDLVLDRCDAFANSLIQTAITMGGQDVVASTLAAANKRVLAATMLCLSTEESTGARWREFLEQGVNPSMAPRPGGDHERADRKELQRAPLGTGLYSPWDAYAEKRGLFDTYQPFNGLDPRDVTGSDDLRVQLVPWAPPAAHGVVQGFSY